jgi:short-subunit dehydrogenase
VAGASEGLGAAFAEALAARGLNLVLIARRAEKLQLVRQTLESKYGVQARPIILDLSDRHILPAIKEQTVGIDVGLIVYNAAFSHIGPFLDQPLEDHSRLINVNCHGPMVLIHHFGRRMRERGRGGILLMSSYTAFQGTPNITHYGSTKAYNLLLAEGLWYELKGCGVDVVACCAGPTNTPNYNKSLSDKLIPASPGLMEPEAVVESALGYLRKGPGLIPGTFNRFAHFIMSRLLTRKAAVRLMGHVIGQMYK